MGAEFFLAGVNAQWDESGGRILLGDNTGIETIMQRPIGFQCVGGALQPDSTTHTLQRSKFILNSDLGQILRRYEYLLPRFPEVSVLKYPSRTVVPGSKAAGTIILTTDFRRFPQ